MIRNRIWVPTSFALVLFAALPACSESPNNAERTAAQPADEVASVEIASTGSAPPAFAQCKTCHSIESGGKSGIGPNLYGIVNARAGSREDYTYSPAMAQAGFPWTPEQLDKYLESPRTIVPGTKMAYAGQKNAQSRKDIIAFLESLR